MEKREVDDARYSSALAKLRNNVSSEEKTFTTVSFFPPLTAASHVNEILPFPFSTQHANTLVCVEAATFAHSSSDGYSTCCSSPDPPSSATADVLFRFACHNATALLLTIGPSASAPCTPAVAFTHSAALITPVVFPDHTTNTSCSSSSGAASAGLQYSAASASL